jgi:hypothetical protein
MTRRKTEFERAATRAGNELARRHGYTSWDRMTDAVGEVMRVTIIMAACVRRLGGTVVLTEAEITELMMCGWWQQEDAVGLGRTVGVCRVVDKGTAVPEGADYEGDILPGATERLAAVAPEEP